MFGLLGDVGDKSLSEERIWTWSSTPPDRRQRRRDSQRAAIFQHAHSRTSSASGPEALCRGILQLITVTRPRSQREIVGNPEQRTANYHLVFVARRVDNHHTGRHQTEASIEMRLCPSPYNSPVGADQWQSKIDSWRPEKHSPKLSPCNEHRQIIVCEVFVYPERHQFRASNRQGTCFDIRPGSDLFNEFAQETFITIVAALHVEGATDCDRSLAPPGRKVSRVVDKISYLTIIFFKSGLVPSIRNLPKFVHLLILLHNFWSRIPVCLTSAGLRPASVQVALRLGSINWRGPREVGRATQFTHKVLEQLLCQRFSKFTSGF